ncbi:hypothetical protein HPB51_001960 [Rhipicephalus microplus]|uniref:Uncharacterized protein n=1 Tax=Rhipicephalus microplus TaxID=6941 RepID=A0A9J6DZB6_RHIMP|nr:hypothetical protein HPB51_001960 [Rhipicephalus microplus]
MLHLGLINPLLLLSCLVRGFCALPEKLTNPAAADSGGRRTPTRVALSRPLRGARSCSILLRQDLITFEADGCNSTGYGPLGDPLLSFTGKDPFFGAPYGDASRFNEKHSPRQASNGLYQLFETHALTGPSPAQSPLTGLSPSAARLTAQIAAPNPSYRGHSVLAGTRFLTRRCRERKGLTMSFASLARSTDNVAAFTDARWPETQMGDPFDGRGPPCSAADPFASRARAPVTAAPASEQSPLHATVAQLLNILLEAVRSQPSALKGDPEFPQPSVTSSLRVPLPEYSGYSDHIGATEYLEVLHRY